MIPAALSYYFAGENCIGSLINTKSLSLHCSEFMRCNSSVGDLLFAWHLQTEASFQNPLCNRDLSGAPGDIMKAGLWNMSFLIKFSNLISVIE